ncbi:hypothetical protein ABGB07_36200 [Micromonosporaceae bacterium B7E4]
MIAPNREPFPDATEFDRLKRAELPEPQGTIANVLDEWLHRCHGLLSGSHNVGMFLELLAEEGLTVSEQTPIPAEAIEAAAKVALRRYESEYSVAPNVTWRDFVPEVRELVEAVAPILLAAGRTAAAEDSLVAELVRAAQAWRAQFEKPAESKPPRMAALINAVDALGAARVAENGADR